MQNTKCYWDVRNINSTVMVNGLFGIIVVFSVIASINVFVFQEQKQGKMKITYFHISFIFMQKKRLPKFKAYFVVS